VSGVSPGQDGPGTASGSWPAASGGGQQDPVAAAGAPPDPSLVAEVAEEAFAENAGVPPSSREEGSGGSSSEAESQVARERDEYRDALQRLQADFENYRKRVAKQTEELRERAAEQLVTLLLPVLDTADLALSHGAGEDVKQLSASLFAVLEKEGLEKIDNAGEPFDPTHHDAVAHEPGDTDGGQEVAEVMRAGYRWRGRVLRAAMVKVRG
jgi:molecular chaperone GrpE